MKDYDVERLYRADLERIFLVDTIIRTGPSPCETCGESLSSHEWVDMDALGYIVACSNVAESKSGDCDRCGFPLDPNGDCGTDITHN